VEESAVNPSSTAETDKDREARHIESLISELTYVKWVKAGKPRRDFDRFWEEAEREIAQRLAQGHGAAGVPPKG
jgi:hypothetical protein